MLFNQNDYHVRVLMNDILLRLEETNDRHVAFAHRLLGALFAECAKAELVDHQFPSTIEHRTRVSNDRWDIDNFG